MNILLSGPPFSGKTTIGTELSQLLGWRFVNTDHLLEIKFDMPCTEQYKKFSENGFRKNEGEILESLLLTPENQVISLGGGTLLCKQNAVLVKKLGKVVYLKCSFTELYRRLTLSGRVPAYLDPNNLEASFHALVAGREPHYQLFADIVVDVTMMTPKEAAYTLLQTTHRNA